MSPGRPSRRSCFFFGLRPLPTNFFVASPAAGRTAASTRGGLRGQGGAALSDVGAVSAMSFLDCPAGPAPVIPFAQVLFQEALRGHLSFFEPAAGHDAAPPSRLAAKHCEKSANPFRVDCAPL